VANAAAAFQAITGARTWASIVSCAAVGVAVSIISGDGVGSAPKCSQELKLLGARVLKLVHESETINLLSSSESSWPYQYFESCFTEANTHHKT
jgi:hypothetical protein